MKQICIAKNWDYNLNLLRQTPNSEGIWNNYKFSLEIKDSCDYLIILNRPKEDIITYVPPSNIWAVIQEPPNEVFKPFHRGQPAFNKIYHQDPFLNSSRYLKAPPALPWFINRTYDQLKNSQIPKKTQKCSVICSKNSWFKGHRKRLNFINKLTDEIELDIFGIGLNYILDKWDGLAPYQYSVVVENHKGPYYWSEKLSDCLLSFTMPIYYGCTNIYDYFPKDSIFCIDIESPHVFKEIEEIINSNSWNKNIDAILEARNLILEKYQFFPFITNEIEKHQKNTPDFPHPKISKISSVTSNTLETWIRSKITVLKEDFFKINETN